MSTYRERISTVNTLLRDRNSFVVTLHYKENTFLVKNVWIEGFAPTVAGIHLLNNSYAEYLSIDLKTSMAKQAGSRGVIKLHNALYMHFNSNNNNHNDKKQWNFQRLRRHQALSNKTRPRLMLDFIWTPRTSDTFTGCIRGSAVNPTAPEKCEQTCWIHTGEKHTQKIQICKLAAFTRQITIAENNIHFMKVGLVWQQNGIRGLHHLCERQRGLKVRPKVHPPL